MVATSSFSIRRLAITGLAAISTLSIGINGLAVRPDHLARSFEPRSHAFTKTEVDVLTGPAAQTTRNSTESKNSTEERIIPDFTPVPNKTDVINITKNWPIDNKKHRDAKDHANIEAFCRTVSRILSCLKEHWLSIWMYKEIMLIRWYCRCNRICPCTIKQNIITTLPIWT